MGSPRINGLANQPLIDSREPQRPLSVCTLQDEPGSRRSSPFRLQLHRGAGYIDLARGEDRPARGFRAVPRASTPPATTLTYGVSLAPASRPRPPFSLPKLLLTASRRPASRSVLLRHLHSILVTFSHPSIVCHPLRARTLSILPCAP